MPTKCPKQFDALKSKLSPIIIRYLALDDDGKLLSQEAIAERSGLAARMVQRLANTESWDGVKHGVGDKFLKGCGWQDIDEDKLKKFLNDPKNEGFSYLNTAQRNRFYKLWDKLDATQK